eukprot:m.74684 g.74684  ORF g.74684 m.74684 type:complete len:69 (-) comp24688_c0_seq1:16-222(-)
MIFSVFISLFPCVLFEFGKFFLALLDFAQMLTMRSNFENERACVCAFVCACALCLFVIMVLSCGGSER